MCDSFGMFQIWFIKILVLGYLVSHSGYCSSLCLPERKYIGKKKQNQEGRMLSSDFSLFTLETRTVLWRYMYLPVTPCIIL